MRRALTNAAALFSALMIAAISVAPSSSSAASRSEGIERTRFENRIKGDQEDFAGSASGVMRSNLRESIWKAAALTTEPHRIRYLFQSHFWDGDVGLYHMRARMFDPRSGTFLSRDPSGYVDSVNLYAPMKWDVVNLRDPTGRQTAGHRQCLDALLERARSEGRAFDDNDLQVECPTEGATPVLGPEASWWKKLGDRWDALWERAVTKPAQDRAREVRARRDT